MEPIKDAYVLRLVERISDHFRANISNNFLRPALLQVSLDKETWDQVEALTEKYERFHYQGFQLYELYRQVAAAARFIHVIRIEIAPTLRFRLTNTGPGGSEDRVLRQMAIANFSSNLSEFAVMINDLYLRLVEIDKTTAKGKKPLFHQIPELADSINQLSETN